MSITYVSDHVPAPVYQLVIIDSAKKARAATLRSTLLRCCGQLGIDPTLLKVLDETSLAQIDAALPIATVYFGGNPPTNAQENALIALVRDDAWILPVVSKLSRFSKEVPLILSKFNGTEIDPADTSLVTISNRVLEELGLVRHERRAFISYRRTETRRAALQIYQGLDERCWNVFLDTHSISPGANFQDALWDKMANADVLLLLDSPGALDSRWVREELSKAHDLGMGVLQLVWPTQTRVPGTEFCEPEYLESSDFSGSHAQQGGARLKQRSLRRILSSIEGVRARAVAARRNRVVREFCASAVACGKIARVQPWGGVEVEGLSGGPHAFIPVVGHPTSQHLHEVSERANEKDERLMVLYDAAGSLARRLKHFRWLNLHLPVQTLPVHESYSWLRAK